MTKRRSPADLLDRVGVPDLWPDIQRRVPGHAEALEPAPQRRRSALVTAVVIALVGVGISIYALSGGGVDQREGPITRQALSGPMIAYSDVVDGRSRVWSMRPDGSDATQVTTGREPDDYAVRWGYSQDLDPQWSPDGQTIYFLRRYNKAIYSLCSISPTGEGFRVLVRDFPAGIFALSPTGSEVAFGAGHAIHVMNVNGSNEHVVASTPIAFPNGVPISWSPDGGRIVFQSGYSQLLGYSQLAIADVATGRITTPVPGIRIDEVAWDPTGALIAFAGSQVDIPNISTFPEQVWVVRPDGTDMRLLTDGGSNWTAAGWSPDGSQLIIGRLDPQQHDNGLAVIGVDGSGMSVIQPSALSAWAAWRP